MGERRRANHARNPRHHLAVAGPRRDARVHLQGHRLDALPGRSH
jgi:hypothetical protein